MKRIINKAESFISKGIKLFCFTALFKNTLTLKFKSQLTYAFFAAINHLSGPLIGKRTLLQWVQKVMVCDLWLVDLNPFCLFLCFKVLRVLVIVIMIDGSEKCNCEGGFWTLEFRMVVKSTVKVVKLKVVKVNVRLVPILVIQCHDYETIRMEFF